MLNYPRPHCNIFAPVLCQVGISLLLVECIACCAMFASSSGKSNQCTINYCLLLFVQWNCCHLLRHNRCLIVIVWWPLEHISALDLKRWATEKKVCEATCQMPRELLFRDITMAQWLMTGPVEVRVCIYPTN